VGWGGRWSLVHTPGTLGIPGEPAEDAEEVARQWLARYGVVSRDWWRRERPAVGWREIYHELKRLEFRGEVRRGYFVGGLAGAQFALPEAVEMLRAAATTASVEPVVLAASDPANPYGLPLAEGTATDPLARPRGAGALLVTVDGRVVLAAEGRGKRLRVRDGIAADVLRSAIAALVARLGRTDGGKRHDIVVETVDGESAAASRHAEALREAGFRSMGSAMRFYVALR
jgi:ATP-dependent Lhr-like helicase